MNVFRLRPWTKTQLTRINFWVMIEFLKTTFPLLPVPHLAKRDVKHLFCPNSKTQLVCPLYCKTFCERFLLSSYDRKHYRNICVTWFLYAIVMQNRLLSYSIFLIPSPNYSLWKSISGRGWNANRFLLNLYLLLVKRNIRLKITEIFHEQQKPL